MNIQEMHQIGMSQCQIAARLDLDRKTVRKYLHGPPSDYPTRSPRLSKVDAYRSYLREHWEQGVHKRYRGLPRRNRMRKATPELSKRELSAGPGVGRHFAVPEVEVRSLTIYEEMSYVATV